MPRRRPAKLSTTKAVSTSSRQQLERKLKAEDDWSHPEDRADMRQDHESVIVDDDEDSEENEELREL